ncbi:Enhancer of mRNA-decapping protein 4 [Vitis vinifera]|uniref:Enhancer of mRNA-decapping protein 4 n=1 Tax=Vitis vinifera TaxID=29760 RepID=A0A438DDT6_VITVI|nr:Enhancer of mRNA-decapping protein 4 [Vitis vinifera]
MARFGMFSSSPPSTIIYPTPTLALLLVDELRELHHNSLVPVLKMQSSTAKGTPLSHRTHLSNQNLVLRPHLTRIEVLGLNSSHPLLIAFHKPISKASLTSKVHQPFSTSPYLHWIILHGLSRSRAYLHKHFPIKALLRTSKLSNPQTTIPLIFAHYSLVHERVTDMAFFAEDVPLLARINEGPNEDDKAHITGKIVIAIQIVGGGASVHPRVCWHSHKQEILVVAIGNRILKIDSTKVGKGEVFSAEEPLKCPIDKLIDGVQFVGKHDGEVTELSMCQWMTTRLASASTDGTVGIYSFFFSF